MRPATHSDAAALAAPAHRAYVGRLAEERERLGEAIARFGVPLDDDAGRAARVAALREHVIALGAHERNGGCALTAGALSPACARCATGHRSISTFATLACPRGCWFCFNPNQHDWGRYRDGAKDWRGELSAYAEAAGGIDCAALTGGEPLLLADEALAFCAWTRERYPHAHIRMYTSGLGATPGLWAQLAAAGLDEVRLSVKIDEGETAVAEALGHVAAAVEAVPAVIVEMPVIPGTGPAMERLLSELERLGAFGVNLLELCFPLHNAAAFRERGLRLARDPFRVPYDYGYAGALPVAGSEELALELMARALEDGTALGLHWCSLENKNTAQIWAQNNGGALAVPPWRFSSRTFIYEAARAFGEDAARLAAWLREDGADDEAWSWDEEAGVVLADPAAAGAALMRRGGAGALGRLFVASTLIERDEENRRVFREVGLHVAEEADLTRAPLAGPAAEEGADRW